jgi:hypothetical protein
MKKRTMLTFLLGIIVGALVFSTAALAKQMEVQYNTSTIYVNGVATASKAIIFEGTNYVKLKELIDMAGLDISYDDAAKTIKITAKAAAPSAPAPKTVPAPAPSEIPRETTVYVTKTGAKYHTGNCSYLRQSKIAITLSNAKAQGYGPCSRCNPPR